MLRIGIVGAGKIAKDHAGAIAKNADCELCAVADIAIERAREIADGSTECFEDYKQMCESVKLDAVILNLPHFLHCEVTKYFLLHGVNVLCEKPMANTVAECDEMIQAAKESGSLLAIGHVQRYFSGYDVVKQYLKSQELGKLTRITEVRNINYFPNRPKWFLDKKLAGGGICMNYGAHSLDKIFYTTGLGVQDVYACMSNKLTDDNVEAGAQILFKLDGGVSASVTYCGCHVPNFYETVFYFTDGAIKVTNGGAKAWIGKGNAYEEAPVEPDDRTFMEKQLVEFVKLLRGEDSKMVTAEYAREIIKVLEKVYESAGI